jgi:hypothetical protein
MWLHAISIIETIVKILNSSTDKTQNCFCFCKSLFKMEFYVAPCVIFLVPVPKLFMLVLHNCGTVYNNDV